MDKNGVEQIRMKWSGVEWIAVYQCSVEKSKVEQNGVEWIRMEWRGVDYS